MIEALAAIVGLVIGSAIAWVVATSRAKLAAERGRAELQSKLAAAESRVEEVRQQLSEGDTATAALREQLDEERQQRARSETQGFGLQRNGTKRRATYAPRRIEHGSRSRPNLENSVASK